MKIKLNNIEGEGLCEQLRIFLDYVDKSCDFEGIAEYTTTLANGQDDNNEKTLILRYKRDDVKNIDELEIVISVPEGLAVIRPNGEVVPINQ